MADYTSKQELFGVALGLPLNSNLGNAIEKAVGGGSLMEAVFDHLVSSLNPDIHVTAKGTYEYRTECPYNGCVRTASYGICSFTEFAGYCHDCRCGSNLLNFALAVANSGLSEFKSKAPQLDLGDEAIEVDTESTRAPAPKKASGSVWIGSYQRHNLNYYALDDSERDIVVQYFVGKGLREKFVVNSLMPYLDAQEVRYSYAKLNREGGKGLSMNVPYVSQHSKRVQVIKRRILPAGFGEHEVTAPKWNLNLCPEYPDYLYHSEPIEKVDTLVLVENPIDAYILNFLMTRSLSVRKWTKDKTREVLLFAAPISLTSTNIVQALAGLGVENVMIAYDCDEAGQKYMMRDLKAIANSELNLQSAKGYRFDGDIDKCESLLDFMISGKIKPVELFKTLYLSSM